MKSILFFKTTPILLFFFFVCLMGYPKGSFANSLLNSIVPLPRQLSFEPFKPKSFDEILAERKLDADVSYILFDSNNSKILEAINPSKQYPMASVTKIMTALYALETLGSEYRFKTTISSTGELEDGVLKGDMILGGEGDPSLSNDHLVTLVENLWEHGVRKVKGDFVVDSGDMIYHRYIDANQPDYLSYNPSISGLNLNFNRVLFSWNKVNDNYLFELQARSEIDNFNVSSTQVSFSNEQHLFKNDDYNGKNDEWVFDKAFLDKAKQRWLPVRNSEKYTAEVFWKISNERGIKLSKPVIINNNSGGKILAEFKSEPLSENIPLMLKYSNNLLSEVLGLSATKKITGEYKNIKASAGIMQSWLESKIGKHEGKLVDHSGLGEESIMSSHELIRFLETSGWQGSVYNLMSDFKVKKSQSSTLKNYTNSVKVKTGSLNFVSNIVGYLETKSGRKLLFVILTSNLEQRNRLTKSDRDNPPQARVWNKITRQLQLDLIEYWAFKYN